MKKNLLVVHGGAPTAVINASLYGVILEAKKYNEIGNIFGAIGGTAGILNKNFFNFNSLQDEKLSLLQTTPASFIGSSRYALSEHEYEKIADILIEENIGYIFVTGGNGSMDTCGKISKTLQKKYPSCEVCVIGIPKTIDNDIAVTDHAPGFGSAAKYLASTIQDICLDVASLPIHVCIVETMGRNAGWLTSSSSLAASGKNIGPHLIYVPEIPFIEEEFLDTVKTLYDRKGGVVVVASEGLKNKNGAPIVEPIFQVGRSTYYGDVSAHLCNLVIKKLNIKARSEKPGIIGRCSSMFQSEVDREEAIFVGKKAVRCALEGHNAVMVGFKRISSSPYKCETILIPVEEVMLHEKTLPLDYINKDKTSISEDFKNWCKPLIGSDLPNFSLK